MSETHESKTSSEPPLYFVAFNLGDFVRIVIEGDNVSIEYFSEEYREWMRSTVMTLDGFEDLIKRIVEIGRILKNIKKESLV